MWRISALFGLLLIAACTSTTEIKRPDGSVGYLIACGASTPWSVCYERANELCPSGYETLGEQGGFNRKELRIACPNEPINSN
jgi:hypothetical protein